MSRRRLTEAEELAYRKLASAAEELRRAQAEAEGRPIEPSDEPAYVSIAKAMLGVDALPDDHRRMLDGMQDLMNRSGGGELHSHALIAYILIEEDRRHAEMLEDMEQMERPE